MDLWHVAAALMSAVLHAGWNAAVKASRHPGEAMAAQLLASAAIALPGLAWTGLPAAASWAWIAGSVALNQATLAALLQAYRTSGFGLAYPLVRAISVMLVAPLAAIASGEMLSAYGVAGVGLIAASLLVLAVGGSSQGRLQGAALRWVTVAGLATAAYVLCDAQGVRRAGSPLAYGFAVTIANGAAAIWLRRSVNGAWRIAAGHAATALPCAAAAVTSYLLILWVFTGAPIAPAAALRDTSAAFAILIAITWLKEPFTPLRLFAVLLSAAAVPLLRFAF